MKLQTGPDDRGLRLDLYLVRQLEAVTRSQIQLLNGEGAIRVNGRQEKSGYRIQGIETIEVDLVRSALAPLEPVHIPLQIYYEDSDIAVIEKPAGLVVHPGAGTTSATVVNALLYHFQNLSDAGGCERPGIVHRLDKKTSGLLLVAKNNSVHARLGRMFHDREVQKRYTALVHGKLTKLTGVIELPISRHPVIRTRMSAATGRGRSAYTEYKVMRTVGEFSLLEVAIKTGRTHQIRVHLSALGHPVVGDDVYGEARYKAFIKKYGPLDRYFLHAAYLRFTHPVRQEVMEFHSDLPPDLQGLLVHLTFDNGMSGKPCTL